MEAIRKEKIDVANFWSLYEQAKTRDEIEEILHLVLELTPEEKELGHLLLNDGIYDANGTLIGEKHPND